MKNVRYNPDVLKALKRHGNMAGRIMRAVREYADDPKAHANNVKALTGSSGLRLRVGSYRVMFDETATDTIVTEIGPRGRIYD